MDYSILKSFVDRKMSIREISKITNKCPTTIRYWLKKHNLKTENKSFKEGYVLNPILKIDGKPIQNCSKCSCLLTEETGYWRENRKIWKSLCRTCFNNYCINRWIKRKKDAISYKGGKCIRCGYDKFYGALEFHHINPNQKDVDWKKLKLRSWDAITKELDKCICVCSNCHREVHHEMRNPL